MSGVTRRIEESFRPTVMGLNGAVTSGHPLSSAAGLGILMDGGSAVDAIVAMAAAVGVVEPNMSGVGGDGFTLVYDRSSGVVTTVNGTGPAPKNATIEQYSDGIPSRGPRSTSVPGAVGGWFELLRRWGRLDSAQVFEPAIRLADDGFPASHNLAADVISSADALGQWETSAQVFLPRGKCVPPGQLVHQPDLARTLREIVETEGESLYRGAIAERLAAAVQQDGGILDVDSLADYQPEVAEPLRAGYRGRDVYEPGPNCSGHVLLQELMMTDQLDLSGWSDPSIDLIHHMVEIKKLAFDDREQYCADPRFGGALPDFLLSKEYACERLELLDRNKAAHRPSTEQKHGHTTYLAAIDRDGNIASMTTSINGSFGSGFIAGDTGILMNNRMTYWYLDPQHTNALEPGKRTRHTVSPAILLHGGQPAIAIGTPGSDGQVQTIYQVLVHMLDFGMHPQQAVEQPRWRSFVDWQDSNWPHRHADELIIEGRMSASVIEGLQARGHHVVRSEPWATGVGSVQVIELLESGVLAVGSDPRRDAYGLAF